ncbi:MAG: hypothetical protein Fur0022_06850 [Anaerolineales bacterium]
MSNFGDEILSKVTGGKDFFSNIVSKIPGFSGYVKREDRRKSDKLLRDTISARFAEQVRRVSELQQEFISNGEIMYVDDLEKAALKLRTFADRIKTASRGYSSLFEAVKINEEELDKILAYDNALLEMSDEVSRAIDHVQSSMGTDGVAGSIRNLTQTSQKCIDTYNRRDEIVLA